MKNQKTGKNEHHRDLKILFISCHFQLILVLPSDQIPWFSISFPSCAEINESESSVMHNTDDVVDENNKDDSSDSLDEFIRIKEEPKEKWDCESILSEF